MTTAQLPKVSDTGGFDDIKGLTDILNSMFGGATTTTGKSESPDSGSMNQADALLQKILGDSNSGDIDAMVNNILDRAKQNFGPAAISGNAAGVRAYSDSTLASMRNEAMARATGEAAAAKLNAINAANNQATQLVTAKLKSSATTKQQQKTSGSPGGQIVGLAGLGMQGYNLLKKKGVIDKITGGMTGTADGSGEFLSGPYGGFDSNALDTAFSAPAGDTSGGGIDGLLDFTATPALEGTTPPADVAPSGDAPVSPDGTGVAAAASVPTGEVVTGGYAMPPAQTVDPVTGIPNSMPPAIQNAEAIDAIPADAGVDTSLDIGSAGFDYGGEGVSVGIDAGTEAGAELAIEGAADSSTFGIYSLANYATGGELGNTVNEGIMATAGGAEDIIGDFSNFATDTIDDIFGAFDGCFMTTAATLNGELDNGITLQTMREFRKTYMQETPERIAEIGEYYILAPFIVKRINESPHSDLLWKKIREDYLTPCVLAYRGGFPEVTHEIYQDMMYWARQQVGLANPEGVH